LFTAEGGHPEEIVKSLPAPAQKEGREQFLRLPKTAGEAREEVDALAQAKVDCVKAVLETGSADWHLFNRLDPAIYQAIAEEARKQRLPLATHTGSAEDVKTAISAGTSGIEHGSMVDLIPADSFAEMKKKQITYDPTLSVLEAMYDFRRGNSELLNRSLLQQVGPADLLLSTRAAIDSKKSGLPANSEVLQRANKNLLAAYQAGVTLLAGSDAGNMLVLHGPTIQHELELWVKAGVPPAAALQAATYNAARALGAENRIGLIQPGYEATLILIDGDPLSDISTLEHINSVYFLGGHIARSELFEPFRKK
jgi:imidazolonepropionase-like amidohydrolase